MDAITQAILGATAAQAVFGRRLGRVAALVGAVGGELADVDVAWGGQADPALPFELHRHFTHALAFIPIGGLVAAAPFLLVPALRRRAGAVCGAATLAYATHAPLDTCTSYGTHLWWPFVEGRTAWDSISIVDPVFTLALLLGLAVALIAGRAWPARAALALALAYLGLGFVQHARAAGVQAELARQRGHVVEHGRVTPAIGNLLLWRSVYVCDGRLHADALRLATLGDVHVRDGTSRPRFGVDDVPPGDAAPRMREVAAGWDAFADGLLARVDDGGDAPIRVGDMRFSLELAGFDPLWGFELDPADAAAPARAIGLGRDREGAIRALWADLVSSGAMRRLEDAPEQ